MQNTIYLDANATTALLPEVREAMLPFLDASFGNASSVHQRGQRARSAVDHAREQVATLIGCRANEVVFTSGGTESDNLALFGTLRAGDHLITSQIEHHAVLHAAEELQKRGVEVTFLAPKKDGRIETEAVRAAIQPNTRLVSIMLANNETGVLNPIAEIAKIAHEAGALVHTDAVQGGGKIVIDVRSFGVDLLSLSAHKMHGPQGAGALFVKKGVKLQPLFFGGAHERQRRAGTENVAAIAGMGVAAEYARSFLKNDGERQIGVLRGSLQEKLLQIPGTQINGNTERVCNTLNIRFDGVDADALVIALDLVGVAASAGSACQSGSTEPSHVLLAMELSERDARSSLRLSLSRLTKADEIDRAAEIIASTVQRLRNASL
ncbi:MAG: cysteine desulfurase [Acidobacteria bacterium]|nr:cysteine desulfurase [Acidobacteriota bacterium]